MNPDERTVLHRLADVLLGWPLALAYAALAWLKVIDFDRRDDAGER